MAKAEIHTPDGISIKIDGTPDEIASVLKEVKIKATRAGSTGRKIKAQSKNSRVTVPNLLEDLRNEGFFKKVKTMAEVKKRLADNGHTYPNTALSGPLRTEVRKKRLRRFKEKGKYVYAQ